MGIEGLELVDGIKRGVNIVFDVDSPTPLARVVDFVEENNVLGSGGPVE